MKFYLSVSVGLVLATFSGACLTLAAQAQDELPKNLALSVNCDGSRYRNIDGQFAQVQGKLILTLVPAVESIDEKAAEKVEKKDEKKTAEYQVAGVLEELTLGGYWLGGSQQAPMTSVTGTAEISDEMGLMLNLGAQVAPGLATKSGSLDIRLSDGPVSSVRTDRKVFSTICTIKKI